MYKADLNCCRRVTPDVCHCEGHISSAETLRAPQIKEPALHLTDHHLLVVCIFMHCVPLQLTFAAEARPLCTIYAQA